MTHWWWISVCICCVTPQNVIISKSYVYKFPLASSVLLDLPSAEECGKPVGVSTSPSGLIGPDCRCEWLIPPRHRCGFFMTRFLLWKTLEWKQRLGEGDTRKSPKHTTYSHELRKKTEKRPLPGCPSVFFCRQGPALPLRRANRCVPAYINKNNRIKVWWTLASCLWHVQPRNSVFFQDIFPEEFRAFQKPTRWGIPSLSACIISGPSLKASKAGLLGPRGLQLPWRQD